MDTVNFKALRPGTILAVGAHPDDIDVTASGTIAKYAAEGAIVHYLVITDGSKGTADSSLDPEKLIEMRRAEQQAALEALCGAGKGSIDYLDYDDGQLEITMGLKKDIVRAIRTYKPDVVITLDPSVLYTPDRGIINHPDHRAAGQATLDAIFPLARDHLSFPELQEENLGPHKVATVLLINPNEHNFSVDITTSLENKLRAVAAHVSQFEDMPSLLDKLKLLANKQGAKVGAQYAEAFMRIDVQPY